MHTLPEWTITFNILPRPRAELPPVSPAWAENSARLPNGSRFLQLQVGGGTNSFYCIFYPNPLKINTVCFTKEGHSCSFRCCKTSTFQSKKKIPREQIPSSRLQKPLNVLFFIIAIHICIKLHIVIGDQLRLCSVLSFKNPFLRHTVLLLMFFDVMFIILPLLHHRILICS